MKACLLGPIILISPDPRPWPMAFSSASVRLATLDSLHKWRHTIFHASLFCLCCMTQWFMHSLTYSFSFHDQIFYYTDITSVRYFHFLADMQLFLNLMKTWTIRELKIRWPPSITNTTCPYISSHLLLNPLVSYLLVVFFFCFVYLYYKNPCHVSN